ncbi:MAG: hypothetical protein QFX35_05820 [Candidatus Verstraetearchaeota archaeon]|nr:hypothetical protein [Candidatus Verstraetearchaeota archaeon]
MVDIVQVFVNMFEDIIYALPGIIAAIIIIAIGYFAGSMVGRAVNKLVEKLGIEKAFDQSMVGKAFRASNIDLSDLIGGVVKAFIIILSIILAVEVLEIPGIFGEYMTTIAGYLPRLLAGILIIIFGAVFVDFLSSFIGKMIRPLFPEDKTEIADMLRNLLFVGLIAFILLLALETLLLAGETVYPLILGFVIIAVGISLTDGLVKSILDDHAEFKAVAGYAKFVLYAIFLIIGAGAIFAIYPGVTTIVANVSWAFAIAFAIMLLPIAYAMAKRMSKETE